MWSAKCWDGENSFFFLGERGDLQSQLDWTIEEKSALWVYNLHYLDCLNVVGKSNVLEQEKLVKNWIQANQDTDTVAWDAYCVSLRVINLIKWCSRNEIYLNEIIVSIGRQAEFLMTKLEYHLLGNHLFANGKALIFAGAFFRGEVGRRFLEKGIQIIDHEIDEQFLTDGAHFELSPMYHQILMWDVCDLVLLAEISKIEKLKVRCASWRDIILKAETWRAAMAHPDSEIAFFNDSAMGVGPPSEVLNNFLKILGIQTSPSDQTGFQDLRASGFFSVSQAEGHKLLINACAIRPAYQPGHSHADSLSFELSVWSKRLFVNSGTSVYGESDLRQWQRGTSAHNTLSLGHHNSSQVWGGFRVAKRARIVRRNFHDCCDSILVEASHDGYVQQSIGGIHRRKWISTFNSLTIVDEITSKNCHSVVRFFLHPDVSVTCSEATRLVLNLDEKEVIFKVSAGNLQVAKSKWYPQFGLSIDSYVLQVSDFSGTLISSISW